MIDSNWILDTLEDMFPDAHCELIHRNGFELLCAVVLSAQTTDAAVNKITPALFARFPDAKTMAEAPLSEIESSIRTIGLYRNKARSLKQLSQSLLDCFDGEIPMSMKDLTSLAGVGRKTANVIRSVWFDIPAIAVDTHVERISKRLGLAKPLDSVEDVERKLKRKIKRERWNRAHHLFIFFGRYHCYARSPKCENCPFQEICRKTKIEKMKTKKSERSK